MPISKEKTTKLGKIILAILVFIGVAVLGLIQFLHEVTDYPLDEIDYEKIEPHN